MNDSAQVQPGSYSAAGVDEEAEQLVFRRAMLPLLQGLAIRSDRVKSLAGVASGHFATVLQIDEGPAIAVTTDGVGTKILVARMANNYYSIGVDCIANNVNDLICIGADPVALLDYIALDRIEESVLSQIAQGLADGARRAGVSIPGGEIAQIGAMLSASSMYGSGPHLDIVGTAIGLLPKTEQGEEPRLLDGRLVDAGDVVLGLGSSGLHSNGYSLARAAIFERAGWSLTTKIPGSEKTVEEGLLEPTKIYVDAVRALWRQNVRIHGLVNISGGGLLNLLRLPAKVTYVLSDLPPQPPIFSFIESCGDITKEEMFATFNMGVGACVIVPQDDAEVAETILRSEGEEVHRLGAVSDEPDQKVVLSDQQLVGRGDSFRTL